MYLIIDTEGTGLFDYKKPADAEGQPRMAEIFMMKVDADLKHDGHLHFYIKPDGWHMPEEAAKINGITQRFLEDNGVPVAQALEAFRAAVLDEGRIVVAHNAQHDLKQLRAEYRRADMDDFFKDTANICTMRALTPICKVPYASGRKGNKFPKLSEACEHFGFKIKNEHTALGDAMACLKLLGKLIELDAVPEAKVHFAKNPPAKTDPETEPVKEAATYDF